MFGTSRSLVRPAAYSLLAFIVVVAVTVATAPAQETQPASPPAGTVQPVKFCAELPAIGNVDLVEEWHFGRIQSLSQSGQEVALEIRGENGGMVTLICPREPFGELAHASRWMENRSNPFPSVRDYIERQIAFDADETGRIIAMASLEPIPRNGRRIANAMR